MNIYRTSHASLRRYLTATSALVFLSVLGLVACQGGRADTAASACGDVEQWPWCNASLTPGERANLLVAAMSLSQKIDFLAGDDPAAVATGDPYVGVVNGIPELGIPDLRMSDGPVGSRGSPATAMPVPLALASTFDPALAYRTGSAVANEVRHKGNDLVHAPVADLIRNPLAGRTFETFGEDPYLATLLTVEWIKGVQDQGILGNVKHFLMNTQEGLVAVPPIASAIGGRHTVNAVVDERTLREIYMPPYEAAVKDADVASVMCAYNYVNGDPACANPFLLQSVLREDWGFDGFLVSDYYMAIKDTVQTANTSPVIEMPYGIFYQPPFLQTAVESGAVAESMIDQHLNDIFRTLFRFGFFDRPRYQRDDEQIDRIAHARVAQNTVEQGSVLLRNNGILPLSSTITSIAVIGDSAIERPSGGGSSFVTPFRFQTPLDAIIERAGPGITVSYLDGSDAAAAAALAAASDVALVFASNIASEGTDKFCLSLDCTLADVPDSLLLNTVQNGAPTLLDLLLDPVLTTSAVEPILAQAFAPVLLGAPLLPVSHKNQDALIVEVAAAQPDTVVVLQTSGAILTPWRENIAALLEAWYPGQEAGLGLAAILFGDTDPGGRLPVSFPEQEIDTPVAGDPQRYPGVANQAEHSEGIFIGYRWFDENQIEPAYPFGFGLSYSAFTVSALQVNIEDDGSVQVQAQIANQGERAGWAVPQLYVGLPAPSQTVPQAPSALKGFQKLWLAAGASQVINFVLDARALSYWDNAQQDWRIAPGCYQIKVGQSSRDLPLQQAVALAGGSCS